MEAILNVQNNFRHCHLVLCMYQSQKKTDDMAQVIKKYFIFKY